MQAEDSSFHHRTLPQNGRTQVRTFGGYGADTDIIVAGAKAYLAALNKLVVAFKRHRLNEVANVSESIV